ncbi:unnamed protein product [Effrenium voratum]|nr:unnamed protein product [Effrenium voratum]
MAHVVFFNLAQAGHINPTLPLVAELRARGVKVTYFVDEGLKEVTHLFTPRCFHALFDTSAKGAGRSARPQAPCGATFSPPRRPRSNSSPSTAPTQRIRAASFL